MIPKKTGLFCTAILTLATNNLIAQVFVSEDFNTVTNPELPIGWTSTPINKWVTGVPNSIAPNAQNIIGLPLNTAEHMKAMGIDGSQADADGAMISSPAVSIPSTATNVTLQYDIAYFNAIEDGPPPHGESLVFLISTDGGVTWSEISFESAVTDVHQSRWDTRTKSMNAYAGQNNLKFGFRYYNQGGSIAGVAFDNFKLVDGADGSVIAALAGDHPDPSTGIGYQLSGSSTTLTGSVKNAGSIPISSYSIKYQVGNEPVQSSSLISTPLASLSTANFPAGLPVTIPAIGSHPIKVWIETAGDIDHTNDTITIETIGVPWIPVKRPVFEEGTGTWCGWCPRGAVFMDHFAATHPNDVAAQIAVHNNDPMTVNGYDSYMTSYLNGYPSMTVDRTIVKDPSDIDTAFTIAQNNFGYADFTMGTPVINGNTVSIPVTIKPVVTISNPKLALVVTESNVTGSGSDWSQNNYYSGGGSGSMGGWENEDSPVEGAYFHFVARSITPAPGGTDSGLPSTLIADVTYTATLTVTVDSGWKTNDLQYIALFINGNTTSIMNSALTALPTFLPGLTSTASVSSIETDKEQILLYPNPATNKTHLFVTSEGDGKAVLTVLDITGNKIVSNAHQMHTGKNTLELETSGLTPGYYFIRFETEKTQAVMRLQVIQ